MHFDNEYDQLGNPGLIEIRQQWHRSRLSAELLEFKISFNADCAVKKMLTHSQSAFLVLVLVSQFMCRPCVVLWRHNVSANDKS